MLHALSVQVVVVMHSFCVSSGPQFFGPLVASLAHSAVDWPVLVCFQNIPGLSVDALQAKLTPQLAMVLHL